MNIFSFLNFQNQIKQRKSGKMYKNYRKPMFSTEVLTIVLFLIGSCFFR